MELKQINYFLEVVEAGSISAAAESLDITQPHLSRQIKALENYLGWQLFERQGRGVTLTPQGEITHQELSKVSRVLTNSLKVMKREYGRHTLRIGYAPSLVSSFLEDSSFFQNALNTFSQIHPEVQLSLHDVSSIEMRDGIERDKLDLVLGAQFTCDAIHWSHLYDIPHILACRPDHPLAQLQVVRPQDLDQQRLLMFSRHDYPNYWEKAQDYFRQQNINAKVAGEFDGIESLILALKAGLGVALITEQSVAPHRPEIININLEDGIPPVQVSVGHASYREPARHIQDFVNLLLSKY